MEASGRGVEASASLARRGGGEEGKKETTQAETSEDFGEASQRGEMGDAQLWAAAARKFFLFFCATVLSTWLGLGDDRVLYFRVPLELRRISCPVREGLSPVREGLSVAGPCETEEAKPSI